MLYDWLKFEPGDEPAESGIAKIHTILATVGTVGILTK